MGGLRLAQLADSTAPSGAPGGFQAAGTTLRSIGYLDRGDDLYGTDRSLLREVGHFLNMQLSAGHASDVERTAVEEARGVAIFRCLVDIVVLYQTR